MLFKAEFFSVKFEFLGFGLIGDPDIVFDALTLEATQISIPGGDPVAYKGDLVSVSDESGAVVYQGIVDRAESSGYVVTYTVKPLIALFDVDVFFDRSLSHHLEQFFAGIIDEYFVNNPDALQNITGLEANALTDTIGYLNIKDNVGNLYEMMLKSLKLYGVWCYIRFDPTAKKMVCDLKKNMANAVIEADLPAVLDKSFVIGDSAGSANKITIINKLDESEALTFYLHSDGSVDTSNTDRITPVVFETSYLEQEEETTRTFAESAYAKAFEHLKSDQYDNEIRILAKNDCRVIDTGMEIGTKADIVYGDKIYSSVLTGYQKSGDTGWLLFGYVRSELTKKIKIARRKEK